MKASFLISALSFERLGLAAGERGWRSDPDYADRVVRRVLDPRLPPRDLDRGTLENLAAMCGEFPAATIEEIVTAVGRFFGKRPRRVEAEGVEYAAGMSVCALSPLPA